MPSEGHVQRFTVQENFCDDGLRWLVATIVQTVFTILRVPGFKFQPSNPSTFAATYRYNARHLRSYSYDL